MKRFQMISAAALSLLLGAPAVYAQGRDHSRGGDNAPAQHGQRQGGGDRGQSDRGGSDRQGGGVPSGGRQSGGDAGDHQRSGGGTGDRQNGGVGRGGSNDNDHNDRVGNDRNGGNDRSGGNDRNGGSDNRGGNDRGDRNNNRGGNDRNDNRGGGNDRNDRNDNRGGVLGNPNWHTYDKNGNYGNDRNDRFGGRGSVGNSRSERNNWNLHRARNFAGEHRTWRQRGGYHGYRIPDSYFRSHFGRNHWFRGSDLNFVFIGGEPCFDYGDYRFTLLEPYPEYWGDDWYDTDDCYVDYVDDGYYLFDNRFPDRPGVAISINLRF